MTVPAVNDDPEEGGRPQDAPTARDPQGAPTARRQDEAPAAKVWNHASTAWAQEDPSSAWRRVAACREREAHWFFPEGDWRSSLTQIDAAKAVCITCRVRRECLEFAYRTHKQAGIWGGLTEAERRELAAELAPQGCVGG